MSRLVLRTTRPGALLFAVALCFVFSRAAWAAGAFCHHPRRGDFEIGLAGGSSLNGNGAGQAMLVGAWQRPLYPDLMLRVEPTLEYLNAKGDTLWTGGFSLVGRKLAYYKSLAVFVDLGAGANLISDKHWAGRRLGDGFMFDLIVGGGFYLTRNISISYRYRHLSNAGLFRYNDGIDSYYILLGIGI